MKVGNEVFRCFLHRRTWPQHKGLCRRTVACVPSGLRNPVRQPAKRGLRLPRSGEGVRGDVRPVAARASLRRPMQQSPPMPVPAIVPYPIYEPRDHNRIEHEGPEYENDRDQKRDKRDDDWCATHTTPPRWKRGRSVDAGRRTYDVEEYRALAAGNPLGGVGLSLTDTVLTRPGTRERAKFRTRVRIRPASIHRQ
jgi:hypothetical protein